MLFPGSDGGTASLPFTIATGSPGGPGVTQQFSYTGAAVAIPDISVVGASASIIVSGLAGAITALAFGPAGPLVGASGAVFGVFGALGGYLVVQRKNIPADFLRAMRGQLIQFVAINAVISFAVPQISGWAHGGGFVMGFVVGALVARPPTAAGVRGRATRALLVGLVAMLLLGATMLPLKKHFPVDPGVIGSPFQRREAADDAFRDVVGN